MMTTTWKRAIRARTDRQGRFMLHLVNEHTEPLCGARALFATVDEADVPTEQRRYCERCRATPKHWRTS